MTDLVNLCYDYGKPALTYWQCIEHQQNRTKVYFYPQTGRTHQLRLHAAHAQGLNHPIVGDELYGYSSDRLYFTCRTIRNKASVDRATDAVSK